MRYTICQRYGLRHRLRPFSIALHMRACKQGKIPSVKSRLIWIAVILLLIVCIRACVPKYPTPLYEVDTYAELSDRVGRICDLPEETVLPSAEGSYLVFLRTRFSGRPAGYSIRYFDMAGSYAEDLSVKCRSKEILPEDFFQITPTAYCNGTAICVQESLPHQRGHLSFIIGDFLYEISGQGIADNFSREAMAIAENIIQQSASK